MSPVFEEPDLPYLENGELDVSAILAEVKQLRAELEQEREGKHIHAAFEGDGLVVRANASGEEVAQLLAYQLVEFSNGMGLEWEDLAQVVDVMARQLADQ